MVWNYNVDEKGLRQLLQKFPGRLARTLHPALLKAAKWFHAKFEQRRLGGRPGVKRITGDLVASFMTGVSPKGTRLGDLKSWLATRSKYAQTQEGTPTGGDVTIRSRRPGGWLAIPLDAAKTPGGDIKGKYAVGGLRNVPGLIPFKSKRGNLLLGEKRGKGLVPVFVLKKEVTIPARLGFFKMFRRRARSFIARFVKPAVRKAIEKGRK